MENKKEYCENLYQEYQKLKKEIDYAFELRDYHPGGKMEARPLPPEEDMKRFPEVKKELREKCRPYLDLDPGEWFEIEQ